MGIIGVPAGLSDVMTWLPPSWRGASGQATKPAPSASPDGFATLLRPVTGPDAFARTHAWLRAIGLAVGVIAFGTVTPWCAFGSESCTTRALALLQQVDTNGYAIVQQVHDDPFFAQWLLCDTRSYGLGLAVHETFHKLDVEKLSDMQHSAYYISPHEVLKVRGYNLFHRKEIATYIPATERDEYFQQYLQGPSGEQDIAMVLEELNAYTHGTITDSKLVQYMGEHERQSTRDGLATFLYYTELYLKRGREVHPTHWRKLAADPGYLALIQRLWQHAEEVLKPIMTEPRLGMRDRSILAKVYSADLIAEMNQLFQAGKRTFRYDSAIWELARQNSDVDVTLQEEQSSPTNTSQVETGPEIVTPSRPGKPQISVRYNGQPVTRQQLEKMLKEQPELQQDEVFMKLLKMLRELEK